MDNIEHGLILYVVSEYENGRGFYSIASELGVTYRRIRKIIDNFSMPRPYKKALPIQDLIYSYRIKKLSLTELGRIYNCDLGTIRKNLKREGIKIRGHREANRLIARKRVELIKVYDLPFWKFRNWTALLSNVMYRHFEDFINPNHEPRGSFWQMDHLYSVSDAFRKGELTFWELCHPGNLKVLPEKMNKRKLYRSVNLNLVKKRMDLFEKIYGNIYNRLHISIPNYIKDYFDYGTVVREGILNGK